MTKATCGLTFGKAAKGLKQPWNGFGFSGEQPEALSPLGNLLYFSAQCVSDILRIYRTIGLRSNMNKEGQC
jgi:hypothetical protein